MNTRRVVLPVILGLWLGLSATATAQCTSFPVDDGFDLGCCVPAAPNLPPFPSVVVSAEYGALLGCHQTFVIPPFAVWFSAPTFITCDYALISVFVGLTSSETISGTLLAKYSRTWIDQSSPVIGQVWRFLVNGDLTCTSTNPINACTTVLPRCASLNIPVHFHGHIDYACDPFVPGGGITASFSLNHMQGCLSHAPWSCVPQTGVVGHDEVSYHIVGPAPFTFSPTPAPQGQFVAEAVRSSYFRLLPTFQYQCFSEAKIPNIVGANFLLTAQTPHCGCAVLDQCTGAPACLAPVIGCYAEQLIGGIVCCPGPTSPFQGFPVLGLPISNTGFLSQSIGSYGGGALYPGFANLTVYFGVMTYQDPCAVANYNIHAVVGVGTSNPFPSGQMFNTTVPTCGPPAQFASTFIDLENILLLTSPNLPPGYGCAFGSDVVWNISL